MSENEITEILIGIFIKVHSELGPGLLESVYEEAICYELNNIELKYQRQKGIPVYYDSVKMDLGFRADIIVEDKVIVELKSIESFSSVHHKIFLTYIKLTNLRVGLMVNFNVCKLKDGIVRMVNKFY